MVLPPVPRVRTRPFTAPKPKCSLERLRLKVEYACPDELKVSKRKLRKHPERQYEHLKASLQRFEFVVPILVDAKLRVVGGEAVLEAAKRIGLEEVPVVKIEHLDEAEVRALSIALNNISSMSSWDEAELAAEIEFLAACDFELPACMGFSSAEIDYLLDKPTGHDDPEDIGAPMAPDQVVSRAGDVWRFEGGHALGCLDARDEASYAALMAGELAGLTFSDPPFNVPIGGHVTRRAGAREFVMATGEMSSEVFTEYLTVSLRHSAAHSRDGSLSLQFMDWRHMREMLAAGHAVYDELLNLAIWAKLNPGMGSPWRSGHELCFIWKKGKAPHIDNVRLGRNGRNRSNVWSYPGANQHRDGGAEDHVTPKNLDMVKDAILDVSNRGDIVLDAFAGSATTLVAAHLVRRRGYGLEFDPAYVDLGVRRMEKRTKAPARHRETGLTFAETAAERGINIPRRRTR